MTLVGIKVEERERRMEVKTKVGGGGLKVWRGGRGKRRMTKEKKIMMKGRNERSDTCRY